MWSLLTNAQQFGGVEGLAQDFARPPAQRTIEQLSQAAQTPALPPVGAIKEGAGIKAAFTTTMRVLPSAVPHWPA